MDRVTPQGLTVEQRMDELDTPFIALSGLQADDSPSLNLTLDDISAVFLRTDQHATISKGIEFANAVANLRRFICRLIGRP